MFSPFNEVCENPTRGRSWFFTSVRLEVFHEKISCPLLLFISAAILVLDEDLNTMSKQGLSLFSETAENLSTQFTSSCVCVLLILSRVDYKLFVMSTKVCGY